MQLTKTTTRYLTRAAVIAALYVVLTLAFAPISYGEIQVRISEMLTILPFFTPAAIPGLFIGCLAANLFNLSGVVWSDVVFGSLATLLGAIGTYLLGKLPGKKFTLFLSPLPPIVFNTLMIPPILKYGYGVEDGILILGAFIFLGELISCAGLGLPFGIALQKLGPKIFKRSEKENPAVSGQAETFPEEKQP